jgi:hypothetical protein
MLHGNLPSDWLFAAGVDCGIETDEERLPATTKSVEVN